MGDLLHRVSHSISPPNDPLAHLQLALGQHHVVVGEEEPARGALGKAQREGDDVDEQHLQPEEGRAQQRAPRPDLQPMG